MQQFCFMSTAKTTNFEHSGDFSSNFLGREAFFFFFGGSKEIEDIRGHLQNTIVFFSWRKDKIIHSKN